MASTSRNVEETGHRSVYWGMDRQEELIARVGPVELWGRRRAEDDPVRVAFRRYADARRALLLDMAQAFRIPHLLDWLERVLAGNRS